MEWINAETNPPSTCKDYVCIAHGKMVVATLREYFYDVKRPNWSVDGVTHYLREMPSLPDDANQN
jgi:hypothetical protein